MSLPFTTTTVEIERPSAPSTDDGYTPQSYVLVGSGVPAVVSKHDSKETQAGGNKQLTLARLHVDLGTDIEPYDRITDNGTSEVYQVAGLWTRDASAVAGIAFIEARIIQVTGGDDG